MIMTRTLYSRIQTVVILCRRIVTSLCDWQEPTLRAATTRQVMRTPQRIELSGKSFVSVSDTTILSCTSMVYNT